MRSYLGSIVQFKILELTVCSTTVQTVSAKLKNVILGCWEELTKLRQSYDGGEFVDITMIIIIVIVLSHILISIKAQLSSNVGHKCTEVSQYLKRERKKCPKRQKVKS